MPSVGYATLQIIPSVRGIGDELRRQLVGPSGDAGDQAGQAAGGGLRDKVKVGAAAAGAVAGALLIAGIGEAMEKANITSTLQAQLGTTDKVAAAQGKIAGKLYSSGVSGSFQDAADAIRSVVQAGLAPPGTTNAQLQKIATKAQDVATVFGQDLGGVTNAVSQMMRTGLAKNSGQAFDIITKGFQSGADKGGDLLDTVNEYGVQFQKAGLTGADAMGLISQAIKAGARDSDLAADAIKEFGIRAVDGSESTKDGFKALGLSADDMAAKFGKGGKSSKAALDLTLDRLRGIKDPVKQAEAATALFGTQAEDLGKALFAMDPSAAAKDLGKFGGATDKLGKTIRSGPSHEIEVFKRRLTTGFVNVLGGSVLPVITDVAHWLNDNLAPAARGLGSAFQATVGVISAVVGWFREWGIWLVPLAILIGGVTLALNAQAIATGLVAAVFAVYRAAILVGTAVTTGFAGAQALLNSVMALNPFVLVAIAVVALGAALVIAWKKSETFRSVVMAAWQGIQTAALWAWNTVLKPVLGALVVAFRAVASAASWLWNTVLKPTLSFIGQAFKVLAIIVAIVVLGPIILAVKAIGAIVIWLWKVAIAPAIRLIGAAFRWLYNAVIRPVWNLIRNATILWWNGVKIVFAAVVKFLRAVLGVAFRWLYTSVIAPVWNRIRAATAQWWAGVRIIFAAVVRFLRSTLGPAFRWLRDSVIRPVWTGIKTVISTVWNSGIKPAFNAIKTAVGKVADAFRNAKNAIKTAWNAIKSATKSPINWVIKNVWNEGIVSIWKKITGWIPGVPKLGKLKMLAAGGTVGAGFGQAATPGVFNKPTAIVGEGNPRHPEFVIPTDPKHRGRALALWQAAGGQLMADGGILGGLKNLGGKALGKAKDLAGDIAGFFANPLKAVSKLLNPLLNKAKSLGSTGWAQMAAGLPRMAIKGLKDLVVDKAGDFFGGGGGGGSIGGSGVKRWSGVVLQALRMVGQPASLLNTVLRRMNQESGGNPRAINLWDSNAKAGMASRGLMQTIPPTFNAYAGRLRGRGIWDPLANIYASMRYALSRYGSLSRAYNRPGGYDSGGWLMPGATMAVNRTGRPEAVLTAPQWQLAEAALARQAQSGGTTYVVNARTADITVRDLELLQRQQDARARVGRPH